mgnify:CR=1 FL=1
MARPGLQARPAPAGCYNRGVSPLSDPPLTKRQLGWLLILAGGLGALAGLGVDVVSAGGWPGLGPAQAQAVGAAALLALLGLSLLPLGDRPA